MAATSSASVTLSSPSESSLYGASSGGVINLFTEDGPEQGFFETRVTLGEYDQQQYQVKAGGQAGALNYLASASHLNYDGYREFTDSHGRAELLGLPAGPLELRVKRGGDDEREHAFAVPANAGRDDVFEVRLP